MAGGGFTLVELLAVIVIIGILAAVAGGAVVHARVAANKVKCLTNQKQIGMALLGYANEHEGAFPPTTHSTGSWKKEQSWIYELAPYVGSVDEVRVCPADPPARRDRILKTQSTSYVVNDLVFDSSEYQLMMNIPMPSRTFLLFILSESRTPSLTRDHIHGGEWTSWVAALNDIEPDRHRSGRRDPDRLKGSANYLFADGHAENIPAAGFKALFKNGANPAAVPHG